MTAKVPWQPNRIVEVSEVFGSSTSACRVQTDAGEAYAKLMGNPEGPHVLLCEYVGTNAARWLGLRTFETAVLDVKDGGIATFPDGTHSLPGPAFLARSEPGTTWGGTPEELDDVQNQKDLCGLVVLDTWFLNIDRYRDRGGETKRNVRNVFLSEKGAETGKFALVAMDMTHCLTYGKPLTRRLHHIDNVKNESLHGNFPEFVGRFDHDDLDRYVSRLEAVETQAARGFLVGAPTPWLPEAEAQESLVTLITDRAKFLAPRIRDLLVEDGLLKPRLDFGAK